MSPSSLPGRAIVILAAVATLIIFSLAIIVVRSRNASRQAANDMAVVLRAQAPVLAQELVGQLCAGTEKRRSSMPL